MFCFKKNKANRGIKPVLLAGLLIVATAGTAFGEPTLSEDISDIQAKLLAEFQNEWQRHGWRWSPDGNPPLVFLFDDALPELQYELPQALIGQFVLVSNGPSCTMFIFPNNKFILFEEIAFHPIDVIYGYIIKINDTWWFNRVSEDSFSRLLKIPLEESQFSYASERAVRKEDMPVPEHLVQGVSVAPWRKAKREYYTFDNSENVTVDFYEIEGFRDSFYRFFYLRIDNGIVRILCAPSFGEYGIYFDGFIDIIEETPDYLKGIIRFTNGTPYFYVVSGTADIVINSDGSITITMLYTPDLTQSRERQIFNEFQFPAKLTLEF